MEKLEQCTDVAYAIVLYTECDKGRAKSEDLTQERNRARQNVVFEHGYLIGKLGRERVFSLVKGNVETPGDISGVVYTPMDEAGAWKLEYAIAYAVLFLSHSGVQSPHQSKDKDIELVIRGCANQARDLQYLQDINPAVYPSNECVLMCVTNEDDMRRVFELVNDRTQYHDRDSYFKALCACFPKIEHKKSTWECHGSQYC